MTNKHKIDFLRNEINKYKQKTDSLKSENIDLNARLSESEKRYFEKEQKFEAIWKENNALKAEYDNCISELREYKDKYLILIKEFGELKNKLKKEFKQLIGKTRNNIE